MFVTTPIIGRLFMRSRIWAWQQVKAGRFGPVLDRGRVLHVRLDDVEHVAGHRFSHEQLAAAGLRYPQGEAYGDLQAAE